MNKQKIIIESLAMDLKRVALGLHRNSINMADRFKQEAQKRQAELKTFPLDNHLIKLINNTDKMLSGNNEGIAEDALMLSVLFQNYAQKKFQ